MGAADAVFLTNDVLPRSQIGFLNFNNTLRAIVTSGRSVVISLGTGAGGAVGESNGWNPFLASYGLRAQPFYSPSVSFTPITPIDGPTSLDDGVNEILWGFGNQIELLNPTQQNGLVTGPTSQFGNVAAIGVFASPAAVPLPASAWVMLGTLAMAASVKRLRRKAIGV
ncbi:MAG: hypothetical protein AAF607_13130 [Pseudomonadota bacterium]